MFTPVEGSKGADAPRPGDSSNIPQELENKMNRLWISITDMYKNSHLDNTNNPSALEAIQSFITFYEANPSVQNGATQELYKRLTLDNLYGSNLSFKDLAANYTSGKDPSGAMFTFQQQWLPDKYNTPYESGPPLKPISDMIGSWFSESPNIPTYVPNYPKGSKAALSTLIHDLSNWQKDTGNMDLLKKVAADITNLNKIIGDPSSFDGYIQDLSSMLNDTGTGDSLVTLASQSNLAAFGSRLMHMMGNNYELYSNLFDIQQEEFVKPNLSQPLSQTTKPTPTRPIDLKADDKKKP